MMNTIEWNQFALKVFEERGIIERTDKVMSKQTCDTKDMLPREEFIQFVCNTFDELKELFLKKNTQYGGGSSYDPLQIFELGAAMHKGSCLSLDNGDRYRHMYEEAKGYERKHVAHVMGNDISAAKVDESLKDIAVYSVIELYMIHKHKQLNNKEEQSHE